MTDLPRIDTVKADGDMRLRVKWKGRRSETVDLTGVVHAFAPFAPLKDPALFRQVSVAAHGSGIAWANGLDFSAESLSEVAEAQRAMTGGEFKRWQKSMALSNAEVATIFGVAKSTVKNYHQSRQLPVAVRIACRKIARQPELFFGLYRPRQVGRPASDRTKAAS